MKSFLPDLEYIWKVFNGLEMERDTFYKFELKKRNVIQE